MVYVHAITVILITCTESLHKLCMATNLTSSSVLLELGCGNPFVAMAVTFAVNCKVLAIDLPEGNVILIAQ